MSHPEEVRELVAGAGADDELQRAALLHDAVEDGEMTLGAIGAEFGSRVAAIVSAMTEDESIEDYGDRKQEHRVRACRAGHDVALLFVADKLSNARRMQRGEKDFDPSKVEHYGLTLAAMREAYPDLPLLPELGSELAGLGRTSARH